MCQIKKGESFAILENNKIFYRGKTYNMKDCEIEIGSTFTQETIDIEPNEDNTKPITNKKSKKESSSMSPRPEPQKGNPRNHKEDHKNDHKVEQEEQEVANDSELDENPQQAVPQQAMPQQVVYPNMNAQGLVPQQQGVPQQQMVYTAPNGQVFYVNPQAMQQQGVPQSGVPQQQLSIPTSPNETKTETKIPEEFEMFKHFLDMSGGNVFVAIALVAGAVLFKQWKAKQDGSNDGNSQGVEQAKQELDMHKTTCDMDRQSLSMKTKQIENEIRKYAKLEDKVVRIQEELETRLVDIEERLDEVDGGINLGFSEEIENKIKELEKALKDLTRKISTSQSQLGSSIQDSGLSKAEKATKLSKVGRPSKKKEDIDVANELDEDQNT